LNKDSNDPRIEIHVKQVAVEGRGAILLTGPSSCGKGEIAKALSRFLSLPPTHHISIGDILRETIDSAKNDETTRKMLANECGISDTISILDPDQNAPELIDKVNRYLSEDDSLEGKDLTQFRWFEYCVHSGLLIPDRWTECLIDAHLRNMPGIKDSIFILDGYPRTPRAAKSLLNLFADLEVGVIKVLHLSITKAEMKSRALARGRADDTEQVLDRRYEFYVEHVQPCIDYLKSRLGTHSISLIDAHQPTYDAEGKLDLHQSIRSVTASVLVSLGLPRYLLDLEST
jgi:adenylate kinase family enzyme